MLCSRASPQATSHRGADVTQPSSGTGVVQGSRQPHRHAARRRGRHPPPVHAGVEAGRHHGVVLPQARRPAQPLQLGGSRSQVPRRRVQIRLRCKSEQLLQRLQSTGGEVQVIPWGCPLPMCCVPYGSAVWRGQQANWCMTTVRLHQTSVIFVGCLQARASALRVRARLLSDLLPGLSSAAG